jgi:hypothetical protein
MNGMLIPPGPVRVSDEDWDRFDVAVDDFLMGSYDGRTQYGRQQ